MEKIALLFVLIFFLSCEKSIDKPEIFLEKEEMTNVLYDITLYTSMRSFQETDSVVKAMTTQHVLKKYGLDSLSFAKLNAYYIQQPKIYEEMFDTINKRFKKHVEQTDALPNDPRDSIVKKVDFIKLKDMKIIN